MRASATDDNAAWANSGKQDCGSTSRNRKDGLDMKRKHLAVLIAILGALLMIAGAQADEYPTNPYRNRVERIHRQFHAESHLLEAYPGDDSFELKMVSTPSFSSGGQFEIVQKVSGSFSFVVNLEDENLEGDLQLLYSKTINSTTFSLPNLTYPTDYCVYVFITNTENKDETYYVEQSFTLAPDGSHPTLDQVVSTVVSSNRADNDWQTALNLHDYLTRNAYYDNTYSFYGADGVLLRGTGVCDSYSKAYTLLLRKAGISVNRVIAYQMNHAWNRVCLNGVWGHVDVTWDDPNDKSTNAVSGKEKHHFFLISDDFIQDGSYHSRHYGFEASPACTTMKSSAIYLLGEEWPFAEKYKDDSYVEGSYTDLIQAQINQHVTSFDIAIYPKLSAGGSSFYDITNEEYFTYYNQKFSLYAYIKSIDPWKDLEENLLSVNITFIANSPTDRKFHVETSAKLPDLADALITLPEGLACVYNGEAYTPLPVVMMGEQALTAETDYTVLYENNLHAGTATMTVSGINTYTGSQTLVFVIQPFNLTEAEVGAVGPSAFVYSGRAKQPILRFEYENVYLLEDENIALTYRNNVQAGNATVQAVGDGKDVTGSCNWSFIILPGGTAVSTLPEDLTTLEAEAFAQTDFTEIILPNHPVTVKGNCFAGIRSQAVQITIPHASSQIDEDAFNELENATIIAPRSLKIGNVSVSEYCFNHGIYYEDIAD